MREVYRYICLGIGLILAVIQVWEGFKHPEKIGNALPWIIVVFLFLVSSVLYLVGVVIKRRQYTEQSESKDDANALAELRAEREQSQREAQQLRERVCDLTDKLNSSLIKSGEFKGELDEVYPDAILCWLKDMTATTVTFSTLETAKRVELSEEKTTDGLQWLKKHNLVKEHGIGWQFIAATAISVTPRYRRFTAQRGWVPRPAPQRGALRDKTYQLAIDLFASLRSHPEPQVAERSANETQEVYLGRVVRTTGPWIESMQHLYEAQFRERVDKLYHELSAARITHDLRSMNLTATQGPYQVKAIAAALFMLAAKMDMQRIENGATSAVHCPNETAGRQRSAG